MKIISIFPLLVAVAFGAPNTPVSNILLQNRIAAAPNTTTYAATTDIDMTKALQTVTLTGNITFTTSNKAATTGIYVTVRVVGDGSNRTLAFPGTWVWVGSVPPTTLIANKVGLLQLICFGATDADVVASWAASL